VIELPVKNMETGKYFRAGDRAELASDGVDRTIDLAPFVGTWINTMRDTQGFAKLIVSNRDGKLFVQAFAAAAPDLCDWGEVEAHPFADRVDSRKGAGFAAHYDTGSSEVVFQANMNLGLLVVLTFNRFKDGSSRANYICREFFHR
jgi:hypothetical protein